MIFAFVLTCGFNGCGALSSLSGTTDGVLDFVLRSEDVGEGRMSMRSVRPFFFLLLLERAELHECHFDEQPLVFGGFVVDIGFGKHLQAAQ